MWMPWVRARIAAGRSVASWNNAAERPCAGCRPSRRSRLPRLWGWIGCPGRPPPGNSQREVPESARAACPRRVAAICRTRSARGLGQDQWLGSEPQPYFVVAAFEVLEGEPADRGEALGVEQHEQPGDPVFGFDGVVVHQPAGLVPAGLGVDAAGGAITGRRGARGGSAFCRRAQRAKSPVAPRWAGFSPVNQVSRSPRRAVERVRSWSVSQSRGWSRP
jgi:hypothetical protein